MSNQQIGGPGESRKKPLVLKFGGSAFIDVDSYRRIARYVAERSAASSRQLVVVVSAMSGTTGGLQKLQNELLPEPSAGARSMLLLTGESVSVALLTSALEAEGVSAGAVHPAGTGLRGTGRADRAELVDASPEPLREVLATRQVVVVPGGQAADKDGNPVMLGRNSSDLSAVAIAGALGAPVCELFSDVPGVCTADPYVVANTRTISRLSYDAARELSRHGAKVVHEHSVTWAERTGVVLRCLPLPPDKGEGTTIGRNPSPPAAVVVERSDDTWRFAAPSARDAVRAELSRLGLDNTPVDLSGDPYLVMRRGSLADWPALATAGQLCEGLRLLTTLTGDGEVQHALVPEADAAVEVRRRHARLYPDTPEVTARVSQKSRSPHSAVLFTSRSQ